MTTGLPEDEVTAATDMLTNNTAGTITSKTSEMCEWHVGRGYRQQRYLHFVRDAVYAVAQALHNLHAHLCGPGFSGVCKAMEHIDGDVLQAYLANVTFNGELISLTLGPDMTDRKNTLTWYSDGKQQMKISAWHLT